MEKVFVCSDDKAGEKSLNFMTNENFLIDGHHTLPSAQYRWLKLDSEDRCIRLARRGLENDARSDQTHLKEHGIPHRGLKRHPTPPWGV